MVYRNIDQLCLETSVVTIGSFDGVHRGHISLLEKVIALSEKHSCRSVVLTFWPHPRQVLDTPGDAPLLLNTLEEKIELLTCAGIDDIIIYPFTAELAQMSASDFVDCILIEKLHTHCLVVGRDHHFGKDRVGDSYSLKAFADKHRMQVEVVDLKMSDTKISSSSVREALLAGDLQRANDMLGYQYTISGKVVHGNHLGRTIGFPTANVLADPFKLIPREGVYRVSVTVDDQEYTGMMYIGRRPVLKQQDETRHIEINIYDFDQEIYGQEIRFSLTHRIRDDINFDSLSQLAEQLKQDKINILNITNNGNL